MGSRDVQKHSDVGQKHVDGIHLGGIFVERRDIF
jgi:hypothetical protein